VKRPSLLGEFRTLMRDTHLASKKLAEVLAAILSPRAS
jgi:hypothetical protein